MKKTIKASAPGKIHLIGEHSSVYGKPAILCAISKRVTVSISESSRSSISHNDPALKKAIETLKNSIERKYKTKFPALYIDISTDLPIGRGLGSSAALCAAAATALFGIGGLVGSLDEIYEAAYVGEKVFHGNPSGGDVAVSVYGGAIWFRKETEKIKTIKRLKFKNSILNNAVFIDSGKPVESTKEMVVGVVGNLYKSNRKVVDSFLEDQEKLTKDLSNALFEKSTVDVFDCVKKAEKNLEAIGVVGGKAKKIISTLKKEGYAAKISGGGGIADGSGIIIALGENKSKILKLCKTNGWESLAFTLGEEGVRIES